MWLKMVCLSAKTRTINLLLKNYLCLVIGLKTYLKLGQASIKNYLRVIALELFIQFVVNSTNCDCKNGT